MYTETLESKGCPPINIAIVMATALEILKNHDSNLLCYQGGWATDIIRQWENIATLGNVNFKLFKQQF